MQRKAISKLLLDLKSPLIYPGIGHNSKEESRLKLCGLISLPGRRTLGELDGDIGVVPHRPTDSWLGSTIAGEPKEQTPVLVSFFLQLQSE